MTAYTHAQSAYTTSSILTAPPERLVVMLFDGAIRFLGQAAAAIDAGDVARANDRAQRAGAIVDELNYSLDMSYGEIPERLRAIYEFSKHHLLECCLRRDADGLRQLARLLTELRDAFEQVANGAAAAAS